MHRPLRTAASGALLCALALGPSACGGDDDPGTAPGPSSTPTLSASAEPTVEISNDLGSPLSPATGVPFDFPTAEVPLLPGPVTQPLGEGSGEEGKRGWFLEVSLDQEFEPCFRAAQAALVARGYVKQPGELKDESNWQAQFIGPVYAVIISTSPSDEGGCRLGYAVGQVRK